MVVAGAQRNPRTEGYRREIYSAATNTSKWEEGGDVVGSSLPLFAGGVRCSRSLEDSLVGTGTEGRGWNDREGTDLNFTALRVEHLRPSQFVTCSIMEKYFICTI